MTRSLPPLALTVALLAWGVAPSWLSPAWALRVREGLRSNQRNAADEELAERGYYEVLNDPRRPIDLARPEAPSNDFGPLTLPVADVREYVLKPNVVAEHHGAKWSTNAQGMRDRDYPRAKPTNTYRIAMAGDSIGAGWGVNDHEGFEPTWERGLDERSTVIDGPRVEVLNFAVPGLAPGQRWEHFEREGWSFAPDLVVFQGTPADFGWDDRKLRSLLPRGLGWDALAYREALQQAGARPGGSEFRYHQILKLHREAILAGVYHSAVESCRSHQVSSAWLLLPRVGKVVAPADRAKLVKLAQAAGFTHFIDLSDAFDGLDPARLAIAPDDFHPNAEGHARLATRLDAALRELLPTHEINQ